MDTEPYEPVSPNRRSDLKTIKQIGKLIGNEEYKALFDKESPLILQFITVSEAHAKNFLELAERELEDTRYITVNVIQDVVERMIQQ